MMKRRKAQGANRSALCISGCKWVGLAFLAILAASGCSYFRPHLTSTELSERLQYGHDRALEELVDIAMACGYRAVNGEGQARQVLELDHSNSGTIHRQFFEVHPGDERLSEVFFLENKGSVDQTQFSRFPRHLRKAIREFLEGLSEARSDEYRPLLIRQEKLSRSMIMYEKNNGARAIENAPASAFPVACRSEAEIPLQRGCGELQFTQKVAYLEKSNLYGLFHLSAARFVFFGKKSKEVFRADYLEADDRHKQLVEKFLETFRPQLTL
jgi:hypothetical protein